MRVDQEPKYLCKRALGRRLLAVEHQDRIRTDRPEDRRQPGDHQAKISVGEVNVGPQQVDRAAAAGHGKRLQAHGTPKADVGPFDREPTTIVDRDSRAAGITQVEKVRRAFAVSVAAGANKDLGNVGFEPRPGLEHADRAEDRPGRRRLGLGDQVAIDQPVAERRRLEPKDLEAVADRNLGEKPPIGRAKQPRP